MQSLKRWAPLFLLVALALMFVNSDLWAQSGGGGGGGWYEIPQQFPDTFWEWVLAAGFTVSMIIGVFALLIWT